MYWVNDPKLLLILTCRMDSVYMERYVAYVLGKMTQNCYGQHPAWQTLGEG
jgi:hypothetical protein